MAAITTHALVKEYPGGVRGVDGVDVTIDDGEFFALLGPSGCGKTTLLRSIAGLETVTEGQLLIGDRDVTTTEPGQRGVAMVFQDYALFPHMDVADNIAYPLKIRREPRARRRGVATEVGDGLSLTGLMERRPAQLSGGQQQRVALARAVATRPDVLLLDEPLSNLDARLRLEARTFLKELQRDLGVTTVFVTHDQAEALALADRIAIMRAGRLEQVGTPRDVFARPATTFVAGFIGSTPMNLVTTRVAGGRIAIGDQSAPLPASAAGVAADGADVVWGARPEYLTWSPAQVPDGLAAEVSVVENLGASVLVTVHVGEHRLQLVVGEDDEPAPGGTGWIVPTARRTLLFDADSGSRLDASAAGSLDAVPA
ncbi:ABC transporter related [Beutenbergia cavernae DSM 12333]|uniref:ABC transporter related n=1 Tax=Beutenbergia cavernae (strain ATCC BAA-8 / DSM 12333 / CCUG 43141 / JCM 11478 / NBRC 16432 / NCIMB 13614 / HKI 0122) TaxID=471853 RepID=C5BWY4_BEUC1|nr:ABC transporter ATP-binding protein [Beutenbergia cavernae]ACQ80800.1 ABC transporter related [Beutenbergia cavernae DSM 12333]